MRPGRLRRLLPKKLYSTVSWPLVSSLNTTPAFPVPPLQVVP